MLKVTRPRFRPRFPANSFAPGLLFGSGIQGVWYDPSDFSTMFQDVAGTTPVTAVGQSVALIRDKSGNGNHATQSVLNSRPIVNVDASGKYFLSFDGTDDSMLTGNINFSATDKITAFVGVRKLVDGSFGVIAELGANVDFVSGCFAILASNNIGYYYQTGVIGNRTFGTGTAFVSAAPVTNVLSIAFDNALTSSAEIQYKVNGQGPSSNGLTYNNGATGNFANAPLYIGRRNNASVPLNGRLYSLIVRGAASTPAQIANTESWVNGKTGAY